MSILIKDMKVPKSCETCAFSRLSNTGESIYCGIDYNTIPWGDGLKSKNCPLIPIPPHGRLIDIDYADDYAYDELELANNYLTGWEAARAMQKIYQNAPVIIPSEEEDE